MIQLHITDKGDGLTPLRHLANYMKTGEDPSRVRRSKPARPYTLRADEELVPWPLEQDRPLGAASPVAHLASGSSSLHAGS
jgi:hypothetical protein